MDKQIKSSLKFEQYQVEKIEFQLNPDCDNKEIEYDFDLDCEIESKEFKEQHIGAIRLKIIIFKNAVENNYPFELSVSVVGIFSSCNMDKNKFDKALKLNGTAILFPFLRSTIADITKTANVNVLFLPLINVHKFLEHKEKDKIEEIENKAD